MLPQKKKWKLCDGMKVVANTVVVINLQFINYQINTLYTLDLHDVIYQSYLSNAEGKKSLLHSLINNSQLLKNICRIGKLLGDVHEEIVAQSFLCVHEKSDYRMLEETCIPREHCQSEYPWPASMAASACSN